MLNSQHKQTRKHTHTGARPVIIFKIEEEAVDAQNPPQTNGILTLKKKIGFEDIHIFTYFKPKKKNIKKSREIIKRGSVTLYISTALAVRVFNC